MNPDPPVPSRKLRWWFWPVLFAPGLCSICGTFLASQVDFRGDALSWFLITNFAIALPLDGLCSACCAVHLTRLRKGRISLPWIINLTIGFFVMNIGLAMVGCGITALEPRGKSFFE